MIQRSAEAASVLAQLAAMGSEYNRLGMRRFGINIDRAFGVSMTALRPLARRYRRNHDLAAELWASGLHEARILAVLIEDPKLVTARQMDDWAADFNSWDLCDQACMKLFSATPFVGEKVKKWAKDEREFVRRAAFALIAGYAVHAKKTPDDDFVPFLAIVEQNATDNRNFVKKAVNWALRQIGKRSQALHPKALAVARRLADSEDRTARWIGRDAVKELTDAKQLSRLGLPVVN